VSRASTVAVLVFDGFADWEPAFALTGLRRWAGLDVVTVGYERTPITSMGGLRILPDCALAELDPAATRLLLLPGGDQWLETYPADALTPVLEACLARDVPIAGICAATTALARAGLFRGRRHTSNGRAYLLEHAPGYETPGQYVEALAVRDRGVISASGLGAVEFAGEIFAQLGVFTAAELRSYHAMYRQGRAEEP
jgi:putative intracellular protease/amidase